MTTLLLLIFDVLNYLSVPWWLYVLAAIGFPLEVVLFGVIMENTD